MKMLGLSVPTLTLLRFRSLRPKLGKVVKMRPEFLVSPLDDREITRPGWSRCLRKDLNKNLIVSV